MIPHLLLYAHSFLHRLFAVNKRRLEALPLHVSLSSLATSTSIVEEAVQHGGCLVFLRDWDLVASYKPPQPADAPTQPSSSQQQQPTYAEALVDVVAEAVAQWRRDIDTLLQQRRRNEASATLSSPPAVVIVAASRHDTWLQQWRDPHSPLRRLFVTRCSPSAETLRNDAGSAPLPSAALPIPTSAIRSASLWRFSSSASALLRCVNEQLQQQQRPSTVTSAVSHWWLTTPLAQAAQTIALERSIDWTALRDVLPLEDNLHDVVSDPSMTEQLLRRRVHWPRLLHGLPHAALVTPLAAENGTPLPPLRVTAHDVRRAFRQFFPHETLPEPPRALQLSATAVNIAAAASAAPSTRQTQKTKTKKTANRIEAVHWEDIGGLDRVRQEILDVLELPFHHPDLFPPHAPRRQGVLLYGPPGTGKTLVAKAVATECQMSFLSVKGPELLDAYVGESEKNVRELFQRALRQAPCVLFFDEVDSLAPARAKRNDSGGGVTDRIVSQLLTELDQVLAVQQQQQQQQQRTPPPTPTSSTDAVTATSPTTLPSSPSPSSSAAASVFVIAATNRPDLLDPALLRPGRFDRKIYLGVCDDIDARHSILRAQTRKFPLAEDVDLAAIASRAHLPGHVTGADLGAVSSAAYARALERRLAQLEEQRLQHRQQRSQRGHQLRHEEKAHEDDDGDVDDDDDDDDAAFLETLRDDEIDVRVTHDDFVDAARHLVPSVVDLSYYEALHRTYDSAAPFT